MARGNTAAKSRNAGSGSHGGGSRSPRSASGARKASGNTKTGRKSGNTGKSVSKKSSSGNRKHAKKRKYNASLIHDDLEIIIVMAVSMLIFIGLMGSAGSVGNAVGDFTFGMFGVMAWPFPFVLFFLTAFVIANRGNPKLGRKLAGAIMLFGFLAAFAELITNGYSRGMDLSGYFVLSMEDHSGGGILGGIIVLVFGSAFSEAGAYIISAAGIVISLILLTQQPLITALGKSGKRAAAAGKARRERKKADRAYLRQQASEAKEAKNETNINTEQQNKGNRQAKKNAAEPSFAGRSGIKDTKTSAHSFSAGRGAGIPDIKITGVSEEPGVLAAADSGDKAEMQRTAVPVKPDSLPEARNEKNDTETGKSSAKHNVKASESINADAAGTEGTEVKKRLTPAEREKGIRQVGNQIASAEENGRYRYPPAELLTPGKHRRTESESDLMATASKLERTLGNFGVNVHVTGVSCGPTVTRYELQPEQGVKVSRIVNLQDDIKLNLAAAEIRIEAPIPGKAAVGIEVPNREFQPVMLREIIDTRAFKESRAKLAFAVGKDLSGNPVIADIEKMPHLLIAGATGSGKSVCINTLIMSLIFKYSPEEVRLLMIDPKVVELKIYDGIPHLLIPVVTDAKKAAAALNWAVGEMTKRYQLFASYTGVRDIKSYNALVENKVKSGTADKNLKKLPRIVVIVDELADLMMVASQDVEDAICRLAQLARAAGIHLVIATQRPSVNVVTGQIKANMPSRIALAVSSGVDSRTIIDMNGAEKLLGKGDMLYYPQGYPKPARVQGAFVSDSDITRVVDFLTAQKDNQVYNEKEKEEQKKIVTSIENSVNALTNGAVRDESGRDEYFNDAGRLIIEKDKASIGMLQRAFKIGFNRAARIMDQLCDAGVVGAEEGTKPRKILMTAEEFEQLAAGGESE